MKAKCGAIFLAVLLIAGMALPCYADDSDIFESYLFAGLCQDGKGFLAADIFNNVIWRFEDKDADCVAGRPGTLSISGKPTGAYVDGKADEALFMEPWDIAPFLKGYAITDASANAVRYFDGETVQTIAGTGKTGSSNGYGTSASFYRPTGIVAGPNGSLFVADTGNGTIRKISSSGYVETVYRDLNEPTGLCYVNGVLYIAETGLDRVIKIENGKRSVVAGGEYAGYTDGPAEKSLLSAPLGVAVSEDGTVYIADTGNSVVRRVKDGRVTTVEPNNDGPYEPVQPHGLIIFEDMLLITDAVFSGILTTEITAPSYTDIDADSDDLPYIIAATERGLINGTGSGEFAPSQLLTRAQLAVMLGRMYRYTNGGVIIDGDASFPDVPADAWYAPAVRWAKDAGLVQGNGELFFPDGMIRREDLKIVLERFANMNGFDMPSLVLSESEAVSMGDALVSRAEAARVFVEFMNAAGI